MMFTSNPEPVAGLTLEFNETIIKDGVPLGVILIDQRERRISGYGQGVVLCFEGVWCW